MRTSPLLALPLLLAIACVPPTSSPDGGELLDGGSSDAGIVEDAGVDIDAGTGEDAGAQDYQKRCIRLDPSGRPKSAEGVCA